jgi:hypothetical protein
MPKTLWVIVISEPMKRTLGILIIIFGLLSCNGNLKDDNEIIVNEPNDTIVGSRQIDKEIAGSNYYKRATEYFVIVNSDTSDFRPILKESKENGNVELDLQISYVKNNTTHRQRLEELRQILSIAASEYNFDTLSGIFVGRLIQMGDLAIKVTEEFNDEFGIIENLSVKDYKKTSDFLKKSQLAEDINNLFRPYDLHVKSVGIEKLFYATKKELLTLGLIETDTTEIPEKILDCLTGIGLTKEK